MAREEEIRKSAFEYIKSDAVKAGEEYTSFGDFINGARWADRTLLDKACDWLEKNVCTAYNFNGDENTSTIIDDFRKAMESSSSEFPNNSKKGGEK